MGAQHFIRLIFVEPIMTAYMLCLYYMIPAINSLYLFKVCRTVSGYNTSLCTDLVSGIFNNSTKSMEDTVSAESSRWLFYQTIAFVIPSTTISIFMGIYADQQGRRLPILLPFLGQALACVWYLVMAKLESTHASFLIVGSLITGGSGGFATITMGCYSHLTSLASERYRTLRLTFLEASLSVGSMLGSFTVGQILDTKSDPVAGWVRTFSVIIAISIITMAYILVYFYFNSHLLRDHDAQRVVWSCNIKPLLSTVCSSFPSVLQLTLVAVVLLYMIGLGKFDVLYQFTQRMGLDRTYYGYYTGFDAGISALSGVICTYVLKRLLFWHDSALAIAGILSATMCSLLLGIAGVVQVSSVKAFEILFWCSPLAGMFSINAASSLRSIAASLVAHGDQSKLFAFITSADAAIQLLTSGIYQYGLWPATEKDMPGLSFFFTAGLTCVSLVITIRIRWLLKRQTSHEQLISDSSEEAS